MGQQFEVFEVFLTKRGRVWKWVIANSDGQLIMRGSESVRVAARYVANKYLFQLLLTSPYRSRRKAIPDSSRQSIARPPA
jgi:hypothetical protein